MTYFVSDSEFCALVIIDWKFIVIHSIIACAIFYAILYWDDTVCEMCSPQDFSSLTEG